MHILQLPVELQQEILFNLAWHEHFIASQVCQTWASIFTSEKFRRKRYVYDKINPNVPLPGSPTNWGFQRYLPQDEGPPWRSRTGGELSLHGLLWSEVLIMVLRREKGEVKVRLLVTADAIGYLTEPKGLGLLKQFHEKRYGRRSFYDITDSPLLDYDKLYFWGKRAAKIPSSTNTESTKKGSLVKRVGFLNSITNALHSSDKKEDKEFSEKESDGITPVISEKLPTDPPVVLFRGPARIHRLKKEKHARYIRDFKSLPSSEHGYWTTNDFEEDYGIGAEPLHYSGSNGDNIREFLDTIKKHLTKHLFECESSNLACWCIFDAEHKYLYTYDQQLGNSLSHRDPRRNIWVRTAILRNGEKQYKLDSLTRTRVG
ncbi:uncharacterized protein DFL_004304 [Arthrobotrys flagrans]|uniref:F-box domain-containing protein n=1 Tax=Arthrobotrys flagrans TaxID=97331 RepID=A0A437A4D7_ARTFL|nr:hypothetical protein DFL_004304 [Arthrobotrys flagrans]